jgi:hypothetical protein
MILTESERVRVKAVDALLSGLVDYAGLFPPASEGMREALENYASYLNGDDRSALGRFIVPISRLRELEDVGRDLTPSGPGSEPWRLGVLLADNVRSAGEEMLKFNRRHGPRSTNGSALIEVVELKASAVDDVRRQRRELPNFFTAYFEIPIKGNVSSLVQAIAQARARAKIRTGGVTPESIPPAEEVIDFIITCQREGVPFKATAGLHHPVRGSYRLTYEPGSPVGTMYGFLNVFLASALLYMGESRKTAIAALEETDIHAFGFDDDAIVWRDKRITADQLEAARQFAVSFGSCSFREPIDELRPLTRMARSDHK